MEEYENIKEMVHIEIEEDEFVMWDLISKKAAWVKEHYSSTTRTGIIKNKELKFALKLLRIS